MSPEPSVEDDLTKLPDRGVDWGVEKSVLDHESGTLPNALMGLQVVVGKSFRGQKLSTSATIEMVEHAKRAGLEYVVLPVRPNDKQNYPLIPMDQYIKWTTPAGLPFDGWLRVHQRLGGETIKVCHTSMIIPGSISDWENWTGQKFPGSGSYVIPGALNPIEIDTDQNIGRYVEPNVWVVHRVGP
ncbi:N-acetyltransferase [Phaeobacter inhibens]|uniref:N-acetyltransferase n=1 Tax=Phaeobacter inhibens TaxID=221822 RepID=UPI0012EB911B|nr:N-acetyltransferase [Phaeobacter inhibens]